MARLEWDKTGEKFFEAGVDHGVLYPNGGPGVPWNGLISIEEQVSGGETEAYYFDGIKYFDSVANEDFQANLQAFTYPDEFAACEGTVSIVPGFSAEYQTRQTFGLSWRTRVGNDIDGIEHSSKIHIVYGATAAPSNKAYQTLGDSPVPVQFEWTINAVPTIPGQGLGGSDDPNDFLNWMWPPGPGMVGWPKGPDGNTFVDGWWATPYVVIDEQDVTPDVYDSIVDSLNGTPETLPYLPSLPDLINLINGNLDLVPPAPVDPNYVPVDPGSGGGAGGGKLTGLKPDAVEVYRGALNDYPNDAAVPYGVANITDGDNSTYLVSSTLEAADWFIYWDTSKIDFTNKEEFTVRFRINPGDIPEDTTVGIQAQLFDAADTYQHSGLFSTNLPPKGESAWGLEDWHLRYNKSGYVDYALTINQEWLDYANDGSVTNFNQNVAWWLAGKTGHVTFSELVTAIKSKPYFVLHFRYEPVWPSNYYKANIQIVEAALDLSPVASSNHLGKVSTFQSGRVGWPNPKMMFGDPETVWKDGSDDTFVRITTYRPDTSWPSAGQNTTQVPVVGVTGSASRLEGMTWNIRARGSNDAGLDQMSIYLDMHTTDFYQEISADLIGLVPVDGEWHNIQFAWTRQDIIDWGSDPDALWTAMVAGDVIFEVSMGGPGNFADSFTQTLDVAAVDVRLGVATN